MGAADILSKLRGMGIKLTADGANIRAEPKAAITEEVRALVIEHKRELHDLLAPKRALVHCACCLNLRMSEVMIPGEGRRFVWGCAKGHMEHGHMTHDLPRLRASESCLTAGDYLPVKQWEKA
jgi:hypothetical protein